MENEEYLRLMVQVLRQIGEEKEAQIFVLRAENRRLREELLWFRKTVSAMERQAR